MKVVKTILYWLPRVLAGLYIVFFGLFALDSLQNPVAFFMHMIPSLVLFVITVIAWKKERLGGILFCLIGVLIFVFYHTVSIALPALAISFLLFLKK